MVRNCYVKFCSHEWYPNNHINFFRFPIKNEVVANQWRAVMPWATLGKWTVVCSEHFNESDFVYVGPRRCLKKGAVPSIFPADPALVNVKDEFCPESVGHPGVQPQVCEHEPQAVVLQPGQGQAYAPRVYERHGTTVPDIPQTQSEARENGQDRDRTAVPGPSQPRYHDVNQIQTDMEVQEEADTTDSTPMVLIDPTDDNLPKKTVVRNEQEMVPKAVHDEKISALRRRLRILQARLRRREAKLSNVTKMLKLLKRKDKCTDDLEHVLLRRFSGFNLELFRNEFKNDARPKGGKRYTEQMKQFASTIYSYSPKAYKFLRTKLNLPNEANLQLNI